MKKTSFEEAINELTLIVGGSSEESRRLRAALGLISAENIKLQRERTEERKERYFLLYPPKKST